MYKKSTYKLFQLLLHPVEYKGEITYRSQKANSNATIRVTVHYPGIHEERVTFVGLFKHGIPNSPPIVGKAFYKKNYCVLDHVPEGTFHLLVTEIDLKSDIAHYFLLNNNYRSKIDHPLVIKDNTNEHFDMIMHLPLPENPPIIVNLHNLVFQAILKYRNE